MDGSKLNQNKTEIVLLGSHSFLDGYDGAIGPLASYCHTVARNLGVTFDNDFKLDKKNSSFFQLRMLADIFAEAGRLKRDTHFYYLSSGPLKGYWC